MKLQQQGMNNYLCSAVPSWQEKTFRKQGMYYNVTTQGEIRRFRISEILRKSDGSSFRHISGGRKHVRAK